MEWPVWGPWQVQAISPAGDTNNQHQAMALNINFYVNPGLIPALTS